MPLTKGTTDEALATQILLNDQPSPSPRDFTLLQDWMTHPKGGASDLRGSGALTWAAVDVGGHSRTDQLALASKSIRTRSLTRLLSVRIFISGVEISTGEANKRKFALQITIPSAPTLTFSGIMFSCLKKIIMPPQDLERKKGSSQLETKLLASQHLCLSSYLSSRSILSRVQMPGWFVIVAFTLAFAGALVSVTEAKRSETFAATAACVAVGCIRWQRTERNSLTYTLSLLPC